MFASLSSFLPSALQQVAQVSRPPDISSSPTTPTDVPVVDPPRKKEKKEKHANEVRSCCASILISRLISLYRLSSSSALPRQSPPTHSASKSSSCPPNPVTIDPFKHSTLLPMTTILISNAPTQTDQKHQPPPAIPRPALSLPLRPHPPQARVVA